MPRQAPLATLRTALVSIALVLLAALVTADPTEINSTAFPGRIEALNQADVSNEVASVISKIHFNPGQLVQAGEKLFTLDPTDFELSLETQQANVLRAEATLKSAEQDFARLMKLKERGSATGVQVLKAEVAQAFADAVRAETQADLKAAQINLDRTVIRAPISGVISPAKVSVGTYVKTGSAPLASIVQLDKVRLSYQVPYVARIEQLNIKELLFPDSLLSRVLLTVKVTDTWYNHKQPNLRTLRAG
jgi:RND family efflux transporter MFP subunit